MYLLLIDQMGGGKDMDLEVRGTHWTKPLRQIWEFWVLGEVVGSYAEGTCGWLPVIYALV